MSTQTRKRGRPKTKITNDDFTRRELTCRFVGYLLERLHGEFADSGLITDQRIVYAKVETQKPFADGFNWKTFGFIEPPATEKEASAFSDGLRCAIDVIGKITFPEFLDEAIKNDGLTLNVSQMIRNRLKRLEEAEDRSEYLPEHVRNHVPKFIGQLRQHWPFPSDILRKVRKPKASKKDVLRLRRVILEYNDLPFVEEIAEQMNVTSAELMMLVEEAKRQKVDIEIGEHKGRKVLIVN